MSVEDFSVGIGEERFTESGQSEAGVGGDTSSSSTQGAIVEDKPLPIPQSLSETGVFWDEILVAIIVVIGATAVYIPIHVNVLIVFHLMLMMLRISSYSAPLLHVVKMFLHKYPLSIYFAHVIYSR